MKGLQQKISKDTSLQEVGAEHRCNAKGFTSIWITETGTVALPEEDGLLGQVLNAYNLNKAYLQVCRNKGSHGVDGIPVELLKGYLKQNGSELIKLIKSGKYRITSYSCGSVIASPKEILFFNSSLGFKNGHRMLK